MDDELFSDLVEFARSKGFEVENLIRTSQKQQTLT
jgi:hypothetical protein